MFQVSKYLFEWKEQLYETTLPFNQLWIFQFPPVVDSAKYITQRFVSRWIRRVSDFVEDFFNLALELEIHEEFENAEEVTLEEVDESDVATCCRGKIYIYESQNNIAKTFFRICKIFEISRFGIWCIISFHTWN